MKYTKQYSTEVDYNNDTERIEPNVSLITDDMEVKFNPLTIDGKAAKAGTIVLAETANPSNKIFVPYQSWDADAYSAYTPIGVVVVPYTHTPDGTVRIMSLKNMSVSTPDSGSLQQGPSTSSVTTNERSMYWGGNGSDIPTLKNYGRIPTVDPSSQESGSMGFIDYAYIPSNYFTGGTASTLDVGTRYSSSTPSGRFGISPYVEYDFRSYKAFYVYNSGTTNSMNDFDGKSNTNKILAVDNATSTAWQTASTISNVSNTSYIHPAAQCCWRYSTFGTSQGQWYLPACGELLYIIPRYREINAALTKLQVADPTNVIRLWNYGDASTSVYGSWMWSSTEYDSGNSWNVHVYNGPTAYYGTTNTNCRVRAFIAFKLE